MRSSPPLVTKITNRSLVKPIYYRSGLTLDARPASAFKCSLIFHSELLPPPFYSAKNSIKSDFYRTSFVTEKVTVIESAELQLLKTSINI